MRRTLLLLAALLATALSLHYSHPFSPQSGLSLPQQQVQYFDQILNHYNYANPQFWKQRYFVNSTFYTHSGPVLLVLCGEGPCGGVPDQSWIINLAKEVHGLVIALEHRYYGDSLPFRAASFETSNLKYLSSEQALRDIGFFIEEVKRNKWYGVSDASKWITVGGSYSGALSAWFRGKYPHLTAGAIASSAVILAVENFRAFDEQIYLSSHESG
jgi:pimeloyl-ACP methyl ester carboxylesterase